MPQPTPPTPPQPTTGQPTEITISLPGPLADRILEAVAATQGYDPRGGQTKPQFLKQVLMGLIKSIVRDHEVALASGKAAEEVMARVDDEIKIN